MILGLINSYRSMIRNNVNSSLILISDNVLQKIIDKLIEIGGCYGMEMNVEKANVMRISRQSFPVKIMIDQNN